jgi:hypothetical protein
MWVVKSTVRPLVAGQLRNELSGVLLPQELEWLLDQPHRPLALGQVRAAAGGGGGGLCLMPVLCCGAFVCIFSLQRCFRMLLPQELEWLLDQPQRPLALGQVRAAAAAAAAAAGWLSGWRGLLSVTTAAWWAWCIRKLKFVHVFAFFLCKDVLECCCPRSWSGCWISHTGLWHWGR